MLRIFRHTLSQRSQGAGGDSIVANAHIPSECSLNNVWGEMHVVSTGAFTITNAAWYSVLGVQVGVPDPATNLSLETLWDEMVPKDVDVGSDVIDLDTTGGANTAPMFEPGEPNVAALLDAQSYDDDKQWFRRKKMISWATSPTGFEAGTPDTYVPRDFVKIRSKRRMFADIWEVAMLGFGSPSFDDVTTVPDTTGLEAEWFQKKYMEVVLEQAWMQLIGLTETGAETPWEDAATLVEDVLEPTVLEEDSGSFVANAWHVYTQCTFDITVPGRREIKQISAA